MLRRRQSLGVVLGLLGLSVGSALAPACSAGGTGVPTGGAGGASSGSGTSSSSGDAGGLIFPDGGEDAAIDVPVNPCGTGCGDMELCDDFHVGLDDDCDGEVDETCSCSTGQVHWCFRGDPTYRDADGCFDGTQKCNELGKWSPCNGGVHATPDEKCYVNDKIGCHAISNPPFFTTDLITGTGDFSDGAVFGTESWTVTCPAGVSVCPGVSGTNPPDDFKPLQSGEYSVTYTKGLADGTTASCTYPLFVGAPGLRVELSWEHNLGGSGVDLDLHLHQPGDTQPWGIQGAPHDCGFGNCRIKAFKDQAANIPAWFPANGQAPEPVSWWKDPVFEKNNCYFAPRNVGLEWQGQGQGCHNPRLDLDNVQCNYLISDPDSNDFCAPENINVDYPPKDKWFRIGVHYYNNNDFAYDVHPNVKVFCDGALTAELGPKGFYDPETPVTFKSGDGSDQLSVGKRFWMVADVAFPKNLGACAARGCVVHPLYADATKHTPLMTYDKVAKTNFGPAYPPAP